ncbi:AAA domain-containing protein [Metabacillus iocasae]|uniref:Superfamily I DNA and/or RNA helicase n=1 Tax=Priestia iocasae TaxID=2291674 RepID=A0ABS2QU20_9BACI|nr:AAA domain-containing protein [Metabacillus iocasae]MBM7702917.1 superfamily I DNA and/or RNA helicase [Metabacillus iocasae]
MNKAKNFFEYLLSLNNMVGKVTRDYKEFEKTWFLDELEGLSGCYLLEDCEEEGTYFEIHRPEITTEDKQYPKPPTLILDWITIDYKNEQTRLSMPIEHKIKKEDSKEEVTEKFRDNLERIKAYQEWERDWNEWANKLTEKKRVQKLYGEFFNLIQQIDKEGEVLEFIYGRGMFCWKHPDGKIGTIRSPLVTTKLEIDLDADKGVISAKQIEEVTSVEREMFSGVYPPNTVKIDALIDYVQNQSILDDKDEFFTQFVRLIDAKGEYIAFDSSLTMRDEPVIYDRSLFSLRRKNVRVLRNDLKQIIANIDGEQMSLPETITAIIGESAQTPDEQGEKGTTNHTFISNDLYFPLESNEQQKEIIHRIERNYGVTVQGPPGTGKTHTIANLVSHFLTQGKKILITSQKENPLKVLKNKIPEEIRDLCVPVLGGGRESLQEIEQSIRVISEKLGELDTHRLKEEISRDREALDQSKRNEAQLKNQLKDYAQKEGSELVYKGENLFKYDVAKRLSESTINYAWIQDNLPMNPTFPLEKPDFQELWKLKSSLKREDLLLHKQNLPEVSHHVQTYLALEKFIEEGRALEFHISNAVEIIEKYQLQEDELTINNLLKDAKDLSHHSQVLSSKHLNPIIEDLQSGGVREERWRSLHDEMMLSIEQLYVLHNKFVIYSINLPDKPLDELKEDITIAKERILSGKKPNFMFFLMKGKQAKYLFETPVLNSKTIKELEDIELLEEYLQFEDKKVETARIFNGHMTDIGLDSLSIDHNRFIHMLDDRMKELVLVIKAIDAIHAFKEKTKLFYMEQLNFYVTETYKGLVDELGIVIQYLEHQKWLDKYNNELNQLREWATNESHMIWNDFYSAYLVKNVEKWQRLLAHLEKLHQTQSEVRRFYELYNSLYALLPLTAKSLELSVGTHSSFPEDYMEAFELRKLQTWLDQTRDVNVSKLKGQIEEEQKEQKRLIRSIVSKSTWKNQVERITDKEKRALSAWKSYIKRFGKGSGKYAHVNLKGAREEMKTAQTAIPVWIMPVSQVLENFPVTNEKFDIIIFDESSQCDLFSINVLMRGKKVIVVGDDEQISPQAIGTNLEDVHELVRRHLKNIPNGNLFDGNISLYEIAEQTFPKEGKLMLREHFRCVPEIIHFSNDLSYGGQMIPLRLPLEEEKIDPPVVAIKVNEGYNDEKDKDLNIPEVEAIVSDIKSMIKDPAFNNQTFGVIALQGQKQAKLLETKIREAIGDREFVKRKIICGNAYTLQGDERDIIFLSLVVASNRRFMALTKTSDKQRFNVAASRAKNQMRLYHSVELEELNSEDLRYKLLSYCKNPARVNQQLENLEQKCESPFELDVLRMIVARGYKVTPQVEVGQYRIDFVIEGLRDRLAVECDGEKWHGPEKFEEDMKRQESLERAGWKFWRVRGREFYFDRMKAMESLWDRLQELGIEPATDFARIHETRTEEPISFNQENNEAEELCWLKDALIKKGLIVIDKRDVGGKLWIVGGSELGQTLQKFEKDGMNFVFTENGSRTTKNLPGWYLKSEVLNLF